MGVKQQKALISVIWVAVVLNLFITLPGWLDQTLTVLGIFLVFAHIIECIMFNRKIRANHTPAVMGFVQVLLFGVVHLNTLPDYTN